MNLRGKDHSAEHRVVPDAQLLDVKPPPLPLCWSIEKARATDSGNRPPLVCDQLLYWGRNKICSPWRAKLSDAFKRCAVGVDLSLGGNPEPHAVAEFLIERLAAVPRRRFATIVAHPLSLKGIKKSPVADAVSRSAIKNRASAAR